MFDQLKAVGALGSLLKNRDALKNAGERVKNRMERSQFTGVGGGGACKVVANGSMRILSVELSPALVSGMAADDKTRTLAGTLIAEATNDAIKQAQDALQAEIGKEAKSMGLGDIAGGDLGDPVHTGGVGGGNVPV